MKAKNARHINIGTASNDDLSNIQPADPSSESMTKLVRYNRDRQENLKEEQVEAKTT